MTWRSAWLGVFVVGFQLTPRGVYVEPRGVLDVWLGWFVVSVYW